MHADGETRAAALDLGGAFGDDVTRRRAAALFIRPHAADRDDARREAQQVRQHAVAADDAEVVKRPVRVRRERARRAEHEIERATVGAVERVEELRPVIELRRGELPVVMRVAVPERTNLVRGLRLPGGTQQRS